MRFLGAGWYRAAGTVPCPPETFAPASPRPKLSSPFPRAAIRAGPGCSRSRQGGPGPAAPHPRPAAPAPAPHLLLQQRQGRAGVDPQVLGGGLPVVSQVGGPVPHHEEVQELRGRGGWGSAGRLCGERPGAAPRRAQPTPPFTCPCLSLRSFTSLSAGRRLRGFGPRRGW